MKKIAFVSIFILLFISVGCVNKPNPVRNLYAFNVAQLQENGPVLDFSKKNIVLGMVSAASGFETRKLIYKLGPNQYEKDFYNEWISPPERLLADQIYFFINGSNKKFIVKRDSSFSAADFVMEILLEGIYADFSTSQPHAELCLKISILDLKRNNRVLLDKSYQASRKVSGQGAESVVSALNLGLSDILNEFNSDLNSIKR